MFGYSTSHSRWYIEIYEYIITWHGQSVIHQTPRSLINSPSPTTTDTLLSLLHVHCIPTLALAMFPQLPDEISLTILNQITATRDLKRLCGVSKGFYRALIDRLYEKYVLRPLNENALDDLNWLPDTKAFRNLCKVKNFAVSSHFHNRTEQRCIHSPDDVVWNQAGQEGMEVAAREYSTHNTEDFRKIARRLAEVIFSLPKDGLRSFRWEIGSCIPLNLMWCLIVTQPSLKHLSLILGDLCMVENWSPPSEFHYPEDFTSIEDCIRDCVFSQLEELSVANRNIDVDFVHVGKILGASRQTLTKIELDFIYEFMLDDFEDVDVEDFADEILHVDLNEPRSCRFPALKTLALGGLDMVRIAEATLHAYNLPRLASLKFRNCNGTRECLGILLDYDKPIDLTSLEVYSTHRGHDDMNDLYYTMHSFLNTYDGLENLFLGFNACSKLVNGGRFPHFVGLVNKQGKNLKRFALHARYLDYGNGVPEGQGHDILDLCYTDSIYDGLFKLDNVAHPFYFSALECLGLSYEPHTLRGLVLPFTQKSTLKILHMRRSGQDRDLRGPITDRGWDIVSEEAGPSSPRSDTSSESSFEPFIGPLPFNPNEAITEELSDPLITPPQADPMYPFHATKRYEIIQLPGAIFDFLNWLFGPDGVRSVRVFAYGDFSHNGRFRAYNHIFCRGDASGYVDPEPQDKPELELNWRPIRADDHELWSLIERNKDFLGSCPTDPLVDDY
ncbi:hypothetical protein HYALB_00011552 [Hymenoscyphus albidus]|uniref:F-box domain-containing protein n=1 Tax=Hymenoscyphus albidus TaxID=595503 RepID=A0A9N9LP10_9HELO|nr:hypothetical protein HYALB_00011552 [Hymenoscyphus albidus]